MKTHTNLSSKDIALGDDSLEFLLLTLAFCVGINDNTAQLVLLRLLRNHVFLVLLNLFAC